MNALLMFGLILAVTPSVFAARTGKAPSIIKAAHIVARAYGGLSSQIIPTYGEESRIAEVEFFTRAGWDCHIRALGAAVSCKNLSTGQEQRTQVFQWIGYDETTVSYRPSHNAWEPFHGCLVLAGGRFICPAKR